MQAAGVQVFGNMAVRDQNAPKISSSAAPAFWQVDVPKLIQFLWLGGMIAALSLAIGFFVAALADHNADDRFAFSCLFVGFGAFCLMCARQFGCRKYLGIWNYLLRPMTICACVITVVILSLVLCTQSLDGPELGMTAGFIAFSLVGLIVAVAIHGKHIIAAPVGTAPIADQSLEPSPQTRKTALILAALWFVGAGGIHRFYVGKIFTGILWAMTGGLFGIGQLIDVAMILGGTFTDKDGRPLLLWDEAERRNFAAGLPIQQTRTIHAKSNSGGLFSAVAGLLLFIGVIVGTAIALDLPAAANVGVFGPKVISNLQQNVFNGYPQWPILAHKVGLVAMGIAFLAGVVAMLFARSSGGVAYQIRGAIGVAGLLALTAIVHSAFSSTTAWVEISPLVAQRQFPVAVDTFLNHWAGDQVFAAGLVLLISIVLLAWPPRLRESGNV
jgi:hypothetical protein